MNHRFKVLLFSSLIYFFCSFFQVAAAEDLKVSNDSKYDLSFSFNHHCSPAFSLDRQSIKIISEDKLKTACLDRPHQCYADVYNAPGCTGHLVATIMFDVDQGVQGLYAYEINTSGNGFNLFFEGPWLLK